MKEIEIEITGTTPLMHHRMPEEDLHKLLGAKTEKKKSEEILTPRQISERHVYKNSEGFYIPMDFIIGAIKGVASDYKQKNTARKSLKSITAGAIRPMQGEATLLDENDKTIADFEVDLRKGTNHQKGAIAICRPRFDRWKAKFKISVDQEIIPIKTVHEMLQDAGKRSGIGSFRVAKGGYFGQFRVTKFNEL